MNVQELADAAVANADGIRAVVCNCFSDNKFKAQVRICFEQGKKEVAAERANILSEYLSREGFEDCTVVMEFGEFYTVQGFKAAKFTSKKEEIDGQIAYVLYLFDEAIMEFETESALEKFLAENRCTLT